MKRSSRPVAVLIALLTLSLACQTAFAAPKQNRAPARESSAPTPVLQKHFDASTYFSGLKAEFIPSGDTTFVSYTVESDKGFKIYFDENATTGFCLAWCVVMEFASPPKPGLFEEMAVQNSRAVAPYLNWSWLDGTKTKGRVYVNFQFLMETATPAALATYYDLMESEAQFFKKELAEWAPTQVQSPRR